MAKPPKRYVGNNQDKKPPMALAYQTGAYTMKEIARQFGVQNSTVRRAVEVLEEDT